MSATPDFSLIRDAHGRLVFTDHDGTVCEGAVPVRAFPVTAPTVGLALVDGHGHELVWIDDLSTQPEAIRQLISDELTAREFMPVIKRIVGVSSYVTPSTWRVETEQGETSLVLKGEEHIRRLTPPALMVADSHGIHYLIRDRGALDAHSRKLLDYFL